MPLLLMVVCQNVGGGLPDWLNREMAKLRNEQYTFNLDLLLFVDAFPASWRGILKFWSSGVQDPRNLSAFRRDTLYLEPAFMAVIQAGKGQLHTLKKGVVCRFTTSPAPVLQGIERPMNVEDWCESAFPEFMDSVKLYIDFPKTDMVAAEALATCLAVRWGGTAPRYSTRSLGDVRFLPRRCFIVTFPPTFRLAQDQEEDFYGFVGDKIHDFQLYAAVGWEHHFEVPEGFYIVEAQSLHFTIAPDVFLHFAEQLVVSKRKVVMRLDASSDMNKFVAAVQEFNGDKDTNLVLRVHDSYGQEVWRAPRRDGPVNNRWPAGQPPEAPWDITLAFRNHDEARVEELAHQFVPGAIRLLVAAEPSLAALRIEVFTVRQRGVVINRVRLLANSDAGARAFFAQYRVFHWRGNRPGALPIIVMLRSGRFEQEFASHALRGLAATRPLTLQEATAVAGGWRPGREMGYVDVQQPAALPDVPPLQLQDAPVLPQDPAAHGQDADMADAEEAAP